MDMDMDMRVDSDLTSEFGEEAEDLLARLPTDLLTRILLLVSTDKNTAVVNRALNALRSSSKWLTTAIDTTRPSITLHPDNLNPLILPFLVKLTSLSSVTLRAARNEKLNVRDLSVLSLAVPRMTSLTLLAKGKSELRVWDIERLLLPWSGTLQHLHLDCCTLFSGVDEEDPTDVWKPELPCLTTLAITGGHLDTLELAGLPNLLSLELRNSELGILMETGATKLQRFVFEGNHEMNYLLLWGCHDLQTVHCRDNSQLIELNLCGLDSLRTVDCCNNECMTIFELTGCKSLAELRCDNNIKLAELELEDCIALQTLSCCNNEALAKLDLSGLLALQQVVCQANSVLGKVDVVGCVALEGLCCIANQKLASLDVSGCVALRTCLCTDNEVLTSLNLSGCSQLSLLACTLCANLSNVDVSQCPALLPGGGGVVVK